MDTVSKLTQIIRDRKGIAIIYVALILIVLIVFVGFSIDLGYMYVAKGQLQNSADAAALAGSQLLTGETDSSTSAFMQTNARQEAWKFACKNKAATANVYIQTNTQLDCNNPPSATDLNGTTNSDAGDIIVGHWDDGARTFTRATGSTNLIINAMQINARRTADSPGGQVGIFFGKVLGWSLMSASSTATATDFVNSAAPLPLCIQACNEVTPLPSGIKVYFQKQFGTPNSGWTSLNIDVGGSSNTPQPTVVSILEKGGNQYDIRPMYLYHTGCSGRW